jgi:hypothetical protein
MSQSQPLSAVLAEIAAHDRPAITVAELTQMFGGRALGALLFVFGIACFLPLPPGATTIFGAPLLVLAPQLVIGASAPWLPRRVKAQTIATADLRAGLPRIIAWLRKIEAISRPRLVVLFSPLGERVLGLVCTLLALVLILPIPLGNMLPALAVSVLSFSLIQRDGLIALVVYGITAASATILTLAAHIVVKALQQGWAVLSHA